jgi:thiamine-phosphate pyrophosphorylase
MDQRLVGWARAVKARQHPLGPVLWLFTDSRRLPDPLPVVACLPKGLCGVVFRHDGAPGRAALAGALARLCRERRLALTIAGDWRLAARLGAGLHLREGDAVGRLPRHVICTASAHGAAGLRRWAGTQILVFLSPVCPTLSHPGAPCLGPVRWAKLALRHRGAVLALGGLDSRSVRRLPWRGVAGVGAIGALGAG